MLRIFLTITTDGCGFFLSRRAGRVLFWRRQEIVPQLALIAGDKLFHAADSEACRLALAM
jgi:hypothetical protein